MRILAGLVLAVVVAAGGAACMSGNSTPGLMPVPGIPPQKTEVFTGTVDVKGETYFSFIVTNVGDLSVTLSSAGPPSTIVMGIGLGLGTASATTCNLQLVKNTAAGDTPQITASQVPASMTLGSSYCVGVGDIGNATGPVTFTLTVVHT